jgi:mannose-6-phosphate isomerase-like protein (cupin superfamily)
MPFFPLAQHEYRQKRPGVFIKAITGRVAQLCMIKLAPGQMSAHHHAEEQVGYILSGRAVVRIGSEEKELGPGEGYLVPTGVHHTFRVVGEEALEYLEVFCPPKSDNALW